MSIFSYYNINLLSICTKVQIRMYLELFYVIKFIEWSYKYQLPMYFELFDSCFIYFELYVPMSIFSYC